MASKKDLNKTLNEVYDITDSLYFAIFNADIPSSYKEKFIDYVDKIFDKLDKD